jgi:uroporphyrinogen decarboxylase
MVEILKSCPKDIVVMGNVDPVGVLKQMESQEVKKYVYELLIKTSEFDNFVLSTGCDLPPGVPLKNIEAFFDALSDYNR